MSPYEKTNMREKACHRKKRLRHNMSQDEKTEQKRLRLSKKIKLSMAPGNDINFMKEAKHSYTGLKILTIHTNINSLCVSVVIGLLLGRKSFTICQRIELVSNRLSVKSYMECYWIELKTKARNQHLINYRNLKELLLSPQLRKTPKGYTTCSLCFSGIQPNMTTKKIHQNLLYQMNLSLDNCHKLYGGQLPMVRKKGKLMKLK